MILEKIIDPWTFCKVIVLKGAKEKRFYEKQFTTQPSQDDSVYLKVTEVSASEENLTVIKLVT